MDFSDSYAIEVLTDKSRLSEIYRLRVEAWESSISSQIINRQKYPEGFIDEFDEESVHLIAIDKNSNKIMSACRVTFFESPDKYPYIGLTHYDMFPKSNFALIGRGVRSQKFHATRLQYDFVSLGLQICRQHGATSATGHAYNENLYMQQLMLDLGFVFLCDVEKENYKIPEIAFPGKLFLADLTPC